MTTPITADTVIDIVAAHYGLDRAGLLVRDRRPHIAEARQVAMLMLNRAGYSMAATGRALARDHSTVVHGVRAVEARSRYDAAVRSDLAVIQALVDGEVWSARRKATAP